MTIRSTDILSSPLMLTISPHQGGEEIRAVEGSLSTYDLARLAHRAKGKWLASTCAVNNSHLNPRAYRAASRKSAAGRL
jgi:hypothetical protein